MTGEYDYDSLFLGGCDPSRLDQLHMKLTHDRWNTPRPSLSFPIQRPNRSCLCPVHYSGMGVLFLRMSNVTI